MVDMARYFLEFTQDESCGKCAPCRDGHATGCSRSSQAITTGKGEEGDIEKLEELARGRSRESSLCGLGQTAPEPGALDDALLPRRVRGAHPRQEVPGQALRQAAEVHGQPEKCTKCGLCFKACTSGAISWQKKSPAEIDRAKCVQCMACFAACRFGAIDYPPNGEVPQKGIVTMKELALRYGMNPQQAPARVFMRAAPSCPSGS